MKRNLYSYGNNSPSRDQPEKPAELMDLSPFPFGNTHRGKPMEDVPAKYLLWLWNEGLWELQKELGSRGRVARYIARNLSSLEMEDKDTIVEHRPE